MAKPYYRKRKDKILESCFREVIIQPTVGIQSTQTTAFDENVMAKRTQIYITKYLQEEYLRLLFYREVAGLKVLCPLELNGSQKDNNNGEKTITASVSCIALVTEKTLGVFVCRGVCGYVGMCGNKGGYGHCACGPGGGYLAARGTGVVCV